jgi:hypothetical protein
VLLKELNVVGEIKKHAVKKAIAAIPKVAAIYSGLLASVCLVLLSFQGSI